MSTANVLFVLGGWSAEMAMIKKILTKLDLPSTAATLEGRMVKSNNAYKADGLKQAPASGQSVYFVECKVAGVDAVRTFAALKRTPELHLGNSEFYFGSSALGQLIAALINDPNIGVSKKAADVLAPMLWEARIVAASEHALGDAYRGKCPGVEPTALRLWRAINRSEFIKESKTPQQVMEDTDAAITKLSSLPTVQIGSAAVIAVKYYIPEMYEAAAIMGETLMYSRKEKGSEKTKVSLINATPRVIETWLNWAKSDQSNLTEVYGSVEKGYAGAFEK